MSDDGTFSYSRMTLRLRTAREKRDIMADDFEAGYREGLKDGVYDGIAGMNRLVTDLEAERGALRASLAASEPQTQESAPTEA